MKISLNTFLVLLFPGTQNRARIRLRKGTIGVRAIDVVFLMYLQDLTLRKHAYSNIMNFFHQKNENIQIKNSDSFHISAQNLDCGYSLEPSRRGGSNEHTIYVFEHRGGSNEYPQSMF